MGKKLASGGFGTVYRGSLRDPDDASSRDVIIKKAKEFGEAEVRCRGMPCLLQRRQLFSEPRVGAWSQARLLLRLVAAPWTGP